MTRRALLVSTSNPYPVVKDGCQRLVSDYVDAMFPQHEVHFLHVTREDWSPLTLFHDGMATVEDVDVERVLAEDFEFVVFIGFKDREFTRRLASERPSFCYTDRFPHPDVRRKPEVAATDGGNTTFFVSDASEDKDDLPNFFGTSAALAPGTISSRCTRVSIPLGLKSKASPAATAACAQVAAQIGKARARMQPDQIRTAWRYCGSAVTRAKRVLGRLVATMLAWNQVPASR